MTEEIFKEQALSASRRLEPMALSVTGSREEAESLLREAFFRAVANRESYNEAIQVQDWIQEIMYNIHTANYPEQIPPGNPYPNHNRIGNTASVVPAGATRGFVRKGMIWLTGAGRYLQDIIKLGFQQYYLGYISQEAIVLILQYLGSIKNKWYRERKEDCEQ